MTFNPTLFQREAANAGDNRRARNAIDKRPAYVAVDAKHKLIFEHEVTNEITDQGHLAEMAVRARRGLSRASLGSPPEGEL